MTALLLLLVLTCSPLSSCITSPYLPLSVFVDLFQLFLLVSLGLICLYLQVFEFLFSILFLFTPWGHLSLKFVNLWNTKKLFSLHFKWSAFGSCPHTSVTISFWGKVCCSCFFYSFHSFTLKLGIPYTLLWTLQKQNKTKQNMLSFYFWCLLFPS